MLRRLTTAGVVLVSVMASGAMLLGLTMLIPDRSDDHRARRVPAGEGPGSTDEDEPATGPAPRKPTGPARPSAPEKPSSPAKPPAKQPRPSAGAPASGGRTPSPPTPSADHAHAAPGAPSPPAAPTPPPAPAPIPARVLQFVPADEPVLCDASKRPAGSLRGANPGEEIRLTSPEFDGPIVLSADDDGAATVMWSCPPDGARTVAVTAWGEDGRRDITFPVTGVSEPRAPSVEEIESQRRTDTAADSILDAVDSRPDSESERGFAGVVVSPDHGEVHLYWKGAPPAAILDAIERAIAATGVRVSVRPADFTRRHLLERAQLLVEDDGAQTAVAPLATSIYRVAVLPEGTGLEVGIARPAGLDRRGVARWAARAHGVLEAALAVRVHLVVDAPAAQFGRTGDAPPWFGGARIVGSAVCSSGFGIRNLEHPPTQPFGLLTAAHCRGDRRGEFRNGDRSRVIGLDDGPGDPGLDSRRILVGEVRARLHSGGVGRDSEFTRPVRRSGRNVKGDEVCTSGAATGAHCDLVVVNADTFYRPAGATTYSSVVEAISRQHPGHVARFAFDMAPPEAWVTIMPDRPLVDAGADVAAGHGDSGGPVFTLTEDGGVVARGTISGGSRAAACGRYFLGDCTADVFFVDIERALHHHGGELATTSERA